MQGLTELLQLPPPMLSFIAQRLAAHPTQLAISAAGPGHCVWQLKKLVPYASGVAAAPGGADMAAEACSTPHIASFQCASDGQLPWALQTANCPVRCSPTSAAAHVDSKF